MKTLILLPCRLALALLVSAALVAAMFYFWVTDLFTEVE